MNLDDQPSRGTLILALGNPLRGDDGAGAAVIETLASLGQVPPGVDLLDGGTPGLETVLLWQGYQRVIVIDAAEMGFEPGEWRRFTREDVILQSRDLTLRGTLHYAGLAEAIRLAEALDSLPSTLTFYGIQPAELGWQPGLTPAVQHAVSEVAQAVLAELIG